MAQLAFNWPVRVNYAPEDFIISTSNKLAVAFIDSWPAASESCALLTGPAASGKTHLVHRFCARTGAALLAHADLGLLPSEQLFGPSRFGVLEDIEKVTNEEAFFHLLRHAESSRSHVLLTSNAPAQELPFRLPDVRSRLIALSAASIAQPDEAMLQAFLAKAFADRQWRIAPAVTGYLALRMERSFSAARRLVEKLEKVIMATNREVTIPLIKPLVE